MLRCWISAGEKRDMGRSKRNGMWHRGDKDHKLVRKEAELSWRRE